MGFISCQHASHVRGLIFFGLRNRPTIFPYVENCRRPYRSASNEREWRPVKRLACLGHRSLSASTSRLGFNQTLLDLSQHMAILGLNVRLLSYLYPRVGGTPCCQSHDKASFTAPNGHIELLRYICQRSHRFVNTDIYAFLPLAVLLCLGR